MRIQYVLHIQSLFKSLVDPLLLVTDQVRHGVVRWIVLQLVVRETVDDDAALVEDLVPMLLSNTVFDSFVLLLILLFHLVLLLFLLFLFLLDLADL